jgi:hypothetical protein
MPSLSLAATTSKAATAREGSRRKRRREIQIREKRTHLLSPMNASNYSTSK